MKKPFYSAFKKYYRLPFKLIYLCRQLVVTRKPISQEEETLLALRRALDDLRNAEVYFQNVVDEDLIDYAVYKMNAALEKYTYLLRLVKQKGFKSPWEIR